MTGGGAPVDQTFHATVQQQLNHQTFLEKILRSKASRNEDRMHAILPLSDYKHKLRSKEQVSQWHITDLISVKLQPYDWASTKHKWQLLFFYPASPTMWVVTLPTFATSTIDWPKPRNYPTLDEDGKHYQCNFDLTKEDSIQLNIALDNNNKKQYKLTIKPKEYYQNKSYQKNPLIVQEASSTAASAAAHDDLTTTHYIYLIGCFAKNKWILKFEKTFRYNPIAHFQKWEHHVCDNDNAASTTGFDIY
ncbi:hypothetical protein BCR42DRAFT_443604 [Absidia repens]|uniref:Uncharacterized protein n=1 Tax=Absidia repens TaxID=90262 RepID=A0A1X2HYQ1_9FUNG|nr:hypothetical protein BCR42DRAFT_443604 [Absidia repens]